MGLVKKLFGLALCFACAVPMIACGGDPQPEESGEMQTGYYVMQSIKLDGIDAGKRYSYYYINVKNDKDAEIRNCTIAGVTRENTTYTIDAAGNVKMKIGRREFTYSYDKTKKTLSFNGRNKSSENEVSSFKYTPNYKLPSSVAGGVSFTAKGQKLFDDDEGIYNYCPSIIYEGNEMHVWFCTDENNPQYEPRFVDLIGYRKGTLQSDGTWVFSDKTVVIKPGRKNGRTNTNEWDYAQCCDPSVVRGDFTYNGEKYAYLMAYLGSKVYDAMKNEVGLAVAKAPEGPWIKVNEGSETAFISFYNDPNYEATKWGIGQPSLISVDEKGKVLIFCGYNAKEVSTNTFVEYYDLSNLNAPQKLRDRAFLGKKGIRNIEKQDSIHNGDFCYDANTKRLYCITDEFVYAKGDPVLVTDSSVVYYVQLDQNETFPCETLFLREDYDWNMIERLDTASTGAHKVHNCGLVTDAYGKMIFSKKLYAIYTISIEARMNSKASVTSYRPYGYEIGL